ncbi:TetR/AcrR family transcriptional regulator [Butyricicoccus sp.]|uniref:TetR/AcrR family transcriptional regulator n=1 Tax=Butyricicoccus sp. TaxID=2049021 RepID=UPI003F14AB3F
METKPNQRVVLTKQLIYKAFLALLKKKSIHKISIRELCEDAGINRTTFYNHYGSQYDVLAEMADNYLDEIAKTISHADVRDKQSVHSRVALVLQFIQDNLELSSMLINNNIDETFAQRLFSLPKIEDMLNTALANIQNEKEKAATISFVISGSYKVLQDWINDPDRISFTEETELILGLAGKACG